MLEYEEWQKQYGYDEDLRSKALSILEDRGITAEQLKMLGGLENKNFTRAEELNVSFKRNSKIAFILYLILLIITIAGPILVTQYDAPRNTVSIIIWVLLGLYIVHLFRSFFNQYQFYGLLGQNYGADGAVLYLLVGMPLYLFMYFYFRNQMKEKMNEIR